MILTSMISYRNPVPGQPTKRVEAHYNGRYVTIKTNGTEKTIHLTKDDLPFEATEEAILAACEAKLGE